MCLDTITAKNRNLSGTGWKVFREIGETGLLRSPLFDKQLYEYNKWVFANRNHDSLAGAEQIENDDGFHIFKLKRDAVSWGKGIYVVKKVIYRKAHTYGIFLLSVFEGSFHFHKSKVAVANEMKILN